MRVLYVLRYWPALTETFVVREIEELFRQGVAVEVLSLGTRGDGALADPTAVPSRSIPRGFAGLPHLLRGIGPLLRGGSVWQDLRDAQGLKAALRAAGSSRGRWDRVHAHFAGEAAEWGLAIAGAQGIPFSVTVHAADLYKPRPSLRAILQAARPVVTVCEANAREIARIAAVASVVVRCGVDPVVYDVRGAPTGRPLRILAVGRNVPKKGLDDLLHAYARLPDGAAALRLVSDRPVDGLAGVTSALASPREMPGLYDGHDLLALPCKIAPDGDRDAVPVALLEAMASGRPVITTPVGGIAELVDDRVGWLVPPGDVDALTAALAEALHDPAERARRGAAGRARILDQGLTVAHQARGLREAWG